jgi:hypothetical protein
LRERGREREREKEKRERERDLANLFPFKEIDKSYLQIT